MSKPIEDKIVSLKMDISDLKSKASEAISTFGGLNKSIDNVRSVNTKGSIVSLGELQMASEKVNFGALARNVDNISSKFSIMGIAGFNAVNRIVNSIFGLSEGFSNAFLTGPIKQGFDEYELKMSSIQTILANTARHGTSLETVTNELDKLNEYADKTIYSFADMTKNVSLFTNSGIKVEDATTMIKGFSNEAAASGASASSAAGAALQLSQALSSGIIRAQDWNSLGVAQIGNANMKDGLVKIAAAMGTLNETSTTAEEIQSNFKGSLEKNWLTAGVMTEYLKIMAGEMDYASMSALGLDDAQIQLFQNQAKMAEEAATKVRTFTQMIGTVKELLASGWTQTWELIFGGFEEATNLWSNMSESIGAFVKRVTDARLEWLKVFKAADGIKNIFGTLKLIFDGVVVVLDHLWRSFRKVFNDSNVETVAKLAEGLYFFSAEVAHLMDRIGEMLAPIMILFFNILKAGLKIVGGVAEVLLRMFPRNFIAFLVNVSVALSDLIGVVHDFFKGIGDALGLGKEIDEVSGKILSWAEVIRGWLESILTGLSNFMRTGTDWLKKMAPIWTEYVVNMIIALKEFVAQVVEKFQPAMDVLSDAFGKTKDALSEFFGATSELVTAWWPLIVEALGIASKWFKNLYDDSKKYFVKAGEIIVEWLQGPLEIIADIAGKAAEAMKEFSEKSNAKMTDLKDTVKTTTDLITTFFTTIGNGAKKAGNWLWEHFGVVFLLVKEIVSAVWDMFRELTFEDILKGGAIAGFILFGKKIAKIFDAIKDKILGVAKPVSEQTDALKSIASGFKGIVDAIKPATVISIAIAIGIFALSIKLLEDIDAENISKALGALTLGMGGMYAMMKGLSAMDFNLGDALNLALIMGGLAAATIILAGALKMMSGIDSGQLMSASAALVTIVIALTGAIKTMSSDGTGVATSTAFIIGLAIAVRIIAGALDNLAEIDSVKLLTAVAAMGAIIFALATFLENTKSAALSMGTATALVITAVAVMVIVKAIESMSDIDPGILFKGLVVVGAVLAGFAGLARVMKGGDLLRSGIGIAMVALAVNLLVVPIKALGEMDWKTLSVGLLAVAIGVMVLGQAAWMAGGVGGVGILLTAIALNLLIAPIAILGSMDLKTLAIGILGLAAALGVIALIAWGLTAATVSVLAFGAGVFLVGLGIGLVGVSLLAFAIGLSVLGTIAVGAIAGILASIGAFLYGLLTLIPLAMEVIGTFFSALAAQFEAFLPDLLELGARVLTAILTGIRNHIYEITTLVIEILVLFALALGENMDILLFAGVLLIIQFIDGLANTIRIYGPMLGNAVKGLLESIIEIVVLALIDIVAILLAWIPGVGSAAETMGSWVTEKLRAAFGIEKVAEEGAAGFKRNLEAGGSGANSGGGVLIDSAISGAESKDLGAVATTQAAEYGGGFLSGIDLTTTNAGALKDSALTALTPGEGETPGTTAIQDYAAQIMAGTDPAAAAASAVSGEVNTGLALPDTGAISSDALNGYIQPFIDGAGEAGAAAEGVSTTMEESMTAPDFTEASSGNMDEVLQGISSKMEEIKAKSAEAAEAGKTSMSDVNYTDPGKEAGAEYSGGIASQNGNVQSSGTTIGNKGNAGAASVSFVGSGYYAGVGFANGITSTSNIVAVAGSNLGLMARASLQKSILEASPSKALMEDGKFFGMGFAIGITGQKDNVMKKAADLALGARDAVQSYATSFSEKLLGAMELAPVITPVMDLSNMKGMDLAGRMNLGSINANMPTAGINTTNNSKVSNNTTTYEINITAQGELPAPTIKRMAQQIQTEIKNQNDRFRISRGEAVLF